jgi:replicative DNA helicase
VSNFTRSEKPKLYSLAQVAKEFGGELEHRAKHITERYGISTGYEPLDDLLRGGGLLPGLMYVIGARPGMGKTMLMQNLAVNVASQDIPTIIFSLEVGRSRLLERMAYQEAGLDYSDHYRNRRPLSDDELERFRYHIRALAKLPIYVQDTAGMSPGAIIETMNTYSQEYGIKVMFIDYLHIMRNDGRIYGGGREREIGTMVEQVRDAAKSLNVSCVLASQLNREVEQQPPFIPSLAHLRDSGSIEQVAYCVMALYRRDYYTLNGMLKDEDGESYKLNHQLDVLVLKQQDGPMGTAPLKFESGTGKVT